LLHRHRLCKGRQPGRPIQLDTFSAPVSLDVYLRQCAGSGLASVGNSPYRNYDEVQA
jgi:hypothetical protein